MIDFKATYEVKSYSPIIVLNRFEENDIVVEDFYEYSPYVYHFKAYKKDEKKLKKILADLKCIKEPFFIYFFKKIFKRKGELLALLIVLPLFYFMTTRIYKLNITGNDNNLKTEITEILAEKNIKPLAKIPTTMEVKEVNSYVLKRMENKLENLEMLIRGGDVFVKFTKIRPPIILPDLEKNYYAKEEGIITRIEVSYGVPLVKEGDYVQKGQLLISGKIDENTTEEKAYGKVYASVWKNIIVECENVDIATNYQTLLQLGDKMILDKECKLLDRLVMEYTEKKDKATMKIHYTIEKNIAYTH